MSIRVLITCGRVPLALELARALHRAGARVVVADAFPVHLCLFSRAVDKTVRVPAPRADPDGFRRRILEVVEREDIDLVLPVCEEGFYLSEARELFGPRRRLFIEPIERIEPLHDKARFIEFVRALGLPAPETFVVRDSCPIPLPDAIRRHGAVLKPVFSRGGTETKIIRDPGPEIRVPAATPMRPWVVQEFVAGRELCAFAITIGGQVRIHVTYEPTVVLGTNSVCFRALCHPGVEAWVRTFAEQSHFEGFLAFDFREAASGELYAIECNPRVTNGVHLVDPVDLAACILSSQGPVVRPSSPRSTSPRGSAMIGLGLFAAACARLGSPGALAAIFREAVRAREVTASLSDPLPLLMQPLCLLYTGLLAARHRISLSEATVHLLDWNGKTRGERGCQATLTPSSGLPPVSPSPSIPLQ